MLSLIDGSKCPFADCDRLEVIKFIDVLFSYRKKYFLAEDKLCGFVFHLNFFNKSIIMVSKLEKKRMNYEH